MTSIWYSHKSTIYWADTLEWVATTNRDIVGLPENQEYEEAATVLIAAAPNLLGSLISLVKLLDTEDVDLANCEEVNRAREVIRIATGGNVSV